MPLDNVVIHPAPKPAVTEPEVVDPKDLEGLSEAAMNALGWGDTKKKEPEPPKKEPTPEEVATAKKAEDDKKAAENPPPKPKKKAAPAPIDPTAIAEQAADAAIRRSQEAKPAPKVEQPAEDPKDARHREVFKVMAEDPRHAGLPQKFDAFLTKEKTFIAKWEKENPGKEFDADDHTDWYAKNEPEYDEDDYREADHVRIARRELAKSKAEDHRIQGERDAQRAAHERVKEATESSVKSIIEAVAPELAKEDGMDLDKLEETDPVAALIVRSTKAEMEPLVREANRLLGGIVKFDDGNPVHLDLMRKIEDQEAWYSAHPSDAIYQGKRFATWQQMVRMQPDQREGFWTLWNHPEIVTPPIINKFSSAAKARIDKIRAKTGSAAGASSTNGASAANGDKHNTGVAKPAAPNTSHVSDKGSSSEGKTDTQGTFGEAVSKALWG